MPTVRTVFLHGAGRAGRAAWAAQSAVEQDGWLFLDRGPSGDVPSTDARRIVAALGGSGHVVAASYGGVAAMLAAEQHPEAVRSLVLFEPACFSLARGGPGVEEHVAALAPVFATAGDPAVSAVEFSRRFAEGLGTSPADLPPDDLEETVARLRATTPPWEVQVSTLVPGLVPTLVLTGGWSPLFEEVAAALVAAGAQHRVLAGYNHRPQDHPDAVEALADFWADNGS